MGQWLDDFRWAMNVMRARRWRRRLLFSGRQKFDAAFRPHLKDETVIAYPDAFYATSSHDLLRAMMSSKPT